MIIVELWIRCEESLDNYGHNGSFLKIFILVCVWYRSLKIRRVPRMDGWEEKWMERRAGSQRTMWKNCQRSNLVISMPLAVLSGTIICCKHSLFSFYLHALMQEYHTTIMLNCIIDLFISVNLIWWFFIGKTMFWIVVNNGRLLSPK